MRSPSGTVDFGASDAPLTSDQATACKGCLQVPWALAATVVTYNVKRRSQQAAPERRRTFKDLPRATSPRGTIRQSKSLNPGVNLPNTHITPVYRSDSSGDSWVFTSYLSSVSPDWKSKVGASTSPSWPTGTAAEKNSGVAAAVQAHGRLDRVCGGFLYRRRRPERGAAPEQGGQFPEPSLDGILAAAKAVTTIQPDGSVPLVNPPASAADAYPMSTYTYAIAPAVCPARADAGSVPDVCHRPQGQSFGPDLGIPGASRARSSRMTRR